MDLRMCLKATKIRINDQGVGFHLTLTKHINITTFSYTTTEIINHVIDIRRIQ